jgi:1-deoxy-D-xylulose-5-phosphate reductoisomerase
MRKLAIIGATGSIGRNCLNVVKAHSDEFSIAYLATYSNTDLLVKQALNYRPTAVGIVAGSFSAAQTKMLQAEGIDVWAGKEVLEKIAASSDYDMLVNAVVGAAGLKPTLTAIDAGHDVALANKETLVVGGELVMARAAERNVAIIPIDSEHSAILQCLLGEDFVAIRRIILTASGGPFLRLEPEKFPEVTVDQALNHPNWSMGKKITIDSATMMNKGLEVIEAHWLFDVKVTDVQVVIHPQSIIHSMVEFVDGSIKAQMGLPDMRVPIQFALTYPQRRESDIPTLDFAEVLDLNFFPPDLEKFRTIALAYEAVLKGGTMPAVMNAANEIAVELFLRGSIHFGQITEVIEQTMKHHSVMKDTNLEDLLASDAWAREFVNKNYGTQ